MNTFRTVAKEMKTANSRKTAVSGRLMEVIVDDRESNAGVLEHLQSMENVTVAVRRLPLGDYLVVF